MESITQSTGIVGGYIHDVFENVLVLKTDAAIHQGNSGGAAFDSQSNFIGIPSFSLIDEETNEQINGILSYNQIEAWLESVLSDRDFSKIFDPYIQEYFTDIQNIVSFQTAICGDWWV